MRTRTPVAAFAALAIILSPNASANAHGSSLDDELLEEKLRAYAAVGDYAALAAVADGDDSWTGAAGNRTVDGDDEARSDDLVRIASLTKSMVAVIVFQLEAEGELDLDDPIADHLPGVLPYEEEITIRQLLGHTAGLGEYFWKLYPSLGEGSIADLEAHQEEHHSAEELIALATEGPLLFPPGEGWSYSTTGYLVLGLLIEDLTGDSLRHQLKKRVFASAGMDDAYFPRANSSGFHGPHTTPYITTGDPSRPYLDTTGFSHSVFWAGGSVVADVDDVNAFYRAAADGTLLTAEQFAEAVDFRATPWSFDYGLGFVGLKPGCPGDPDEMFMGHTGGGVGHTTYSFHSLDGQRQVTLTWNLDNSHGTVDPDELQRTQDEFIAAALCGTDTAAPAVTVEQLTALL
ncbi:serine hydrolase domain-containing protein [Glycomyces paridis]|uniref:Beta-lactamase family protein n=1 Tax=Glycomyces paridis TaxID=2126555 RepID=A0A4S8PI55_9ACTN|nr:serine hydrolase domain-containing protein [Glycomyces paridis]THV29102.1 beta-lactamase family protein [Glycomyces paridis]